MLFRSNVSVMQLLAAVATALALFSAASAAPTVQLKTVDKYAGSIKPSSYIIKLKDGVSKDAHLAWLAETVGASATVTHAEWAAEVVNGFAGEFGMAPACWRRRRRTVP